MDNNDMYDRLLVKVKRFASLYEKIRSENAALEQKISDSQETISFLQNENNRFKADNEMLSQKLSEQNKKLAELTEKVDAQNKNSEIESKIMALLSALPDDSDEINDSADAMSQSQTSADNDAASEQNPVTESDDASAADEPQSEEDPADAILNRFMSYDTEADSAAGIISSVLPAGESAAHNDAYLGISTLHSDDASAVDKEDTANPDNDIDNYAGLFDDAAYGDDNADSGQSVLFGDDLPTEEEWNGSTSADKPDGRTDLFNGQSDNEPADSFLEASDKQHNNEEADRAALGEDQSAAVSDNSYAGSIRSDDYNSILLSDDDGEEEVDFDMDDDENIETEEDDPADSDYEDGYAPGVM